MEDKEAPKIEKMHGSGENEVRHDAIPLIKQTLAAFNRITAA
jgi:hypothetical protein